MREILILVRNFPPYNDKGRAGVGYVIRALKFCKYLPSFGFKPVVITVDKNPDRQIEPKKDLLLKEISTTTEIHYVPESRLLRMVETLSIRKRKLQRIRKRSLKYGVRFLFAGLLSGIAKNLFHVVKKRFLVPDEGVLWNRNVLAYASGLIQKRKIAYLMTISPHNSTHLVGMDLKKKFALTWCADFKDAWVGNPLFTSKSAARNRKEERQEKAVLEHADIITSVNDPSVDLLKHHAERARGKRFATIYNGFDPDELDAPAAVYDGDFINLIHCGVLYAQRTLGPFLHVVAEMVERKKRPFRVYLLGKVEDEPCFRYQQRYPDVVHILGVASRQKTISMIKGADVTLVVQSDFYFAPLSGKIFEYLACDKRVVGLVPKGIARDFIRNFDMGWSCDLDDEESIRGILEEVYGLWEDRRLGIRYPAGVKNLFDRKASTEKLADLLRGDQGET